MSQISYTFAANLACIHRGEEVGKINCQPCRGNVKLRTFRCSIHRRCTHSKTIPGVACCLHCPDRKATGEKIVSSVQWAYGVTTCKERLKTFLPQTLASLCAAGFDRPWLFCDGVKDSEDLAYLLKDRHVEGYTLRSNAVRTYGNWVLALAETFIRHPDADRYAIFQDDLITYRNLKDYLTALPLASRVYWNLYTFPHNQSLAPADGSHGFYESCQMGKGAVGLVFSQQGVMDLLTHQHMVERPLDAHRGWRAVDGGVVTALKKAGYMELVHHPTLVQHVGDVSSMGNNPHKQAVSFRGEAFDAMELLPKRLEEGA